jgi:hypothetical protein
MGGFIRSFTRIFSKVIAPPAAQVAQKVSAPLVVAKKVEEKLDKRQTLASGGYGSSSVLTSQQGIEDEANVSKTVLGGTVQKRPKKV